MFFMIGFGSQQGEDTISACSANELHLLVYCGAEGLGVVLRHYVNTIYYDD